AARSYGQGKGRPRAPPFPTSFPEALEIRYLRIYFYCRWRGHPDHPVLFHERNQRRDCFIRRQHRRPLRRRRREIVDHHPLLVGVWFGNDNGRRDRSRRHLRSRPRLRRDGVITLSDSRIQLRTGKKSWRTPKLCGLFEGVSERDQFWL